MHGEAGIKQKAMYSGNSMKSMHLSVEASLKKLRTTYIDILYVHWWDWETSIEEVMNGLHTLVQQGKVLYLVRPGAFRDFQSFNPILPSRAFLTLPRGWFLRQTSTLATMARRRS